MLGTPLKKSQFVFPLSEEGMDRRHSSDFPFGSWYLYIVDGSKQRQAALAAQPIPNLSKSVWDSFWTGL